MHLRHHFTEKEYEMKSRILLAGLVLFSLVLAACGGSASSSFPTGTFIKEGAEEYGLKFNEDGTFEVFNGTQTFVHGSYKVEGNVLTETGNDAGCETNVGFNYTFDGSNLNFTYAGDPEADKECSGRYADFNDVTYILRK